ncbi:hypothetical protein GE061_000212 [Apolygus lucorum]|uniref:Uncharacterized protein n=1 Tax=Apolygus lucorum TaxID=248454 RepID=A0A8S9Y3R0_APOLU|nr:hypothetical protein GE061_000212 [Apolygus lucorum]
MVGPHKNDKKGNRRRISSTPYPLRRNVKVARGESSCNTAKKSVPEPRENLRDVEMAVEGSASSQTQVDETEKLDGSREFRGAQGDEMDTEEIPISDEERNQGTKRKWEGSEGEDAGKSGPEEIKNSTKKIILQLEHDVIIELEDEEGEYDVPVVKEASPIPLNVVAENWEENRKMEVTGEREGGKGVLEVQENVTEDSNATSSKLIVIDVPPDSTNVQDPEVETGENESDFFELQALQPIQNGQSQATSSTPTSSTSSETEEPKSDSSHFSSSIKELMTPETNSTSTSEDQDTSKSSTSSPAYTTMQSLEIPLNTGASFLGRSYSFEPPRSLGSEVSFWNKVPNLETVRGESSEYKSDSHKTFEQSETGKYGMNVGDSSAPEKTALRPLTEESGFLSDMEKNTSSPLSVSSTVSENSMKTGEIPKTGFPTATRRMQTREMETLGESSTSKKAETEFPAPNPQAVPSSSKCGSDESKAEPRSGTHGRNPPQTPSTSSSQDEDETLLAVKLFEISLQDMIKNLGPAETAEELAAANITSRPWFHRPIPLGSWVAMQIGSEWYPGTVEDVNFPNITVVLMERGPERHLFYWPESENRQVLHQRYLLSILENPPHLSLNGMLSITDYPFIDFLCHDTWS